MLFPCHYTPAGPGGPFYEGASHPGGLNSFPIYTQEQLEEYAAAAVLLNEANRIEEKDE